MGLYLCVFDGDEDIDGVDVGGYDVDFLRKCICERLERGRPGSRFPTLMCHSDCDGEWSVADCFVLESELNFIISELAELPPRDLPGAWQGRLAKSLGIVPRTLADSFLDVDGEPLLTRLRDLCRLAIQRGQPIVFQ